MTLRLAFGLLIGILLALSVTGRADSQPGVWDRLQNGSGNTIHAKITRLEVAPKRVSVGYREVGMDEPGSKSAVLCREDSTINNANVEHSQRIESLRTAFKSGEIVELGMTGPWSPCLNSITLTK